MTQAPDSPASELPNLEADMDCHLRRAPSKPPRLFMIGAAVATVILGVAALLVVSSQGEPLEAELSATDLDTVIPINEAESESPDAVDATRIPELENRLMMLVQQLKAQSELAQQNQQKLLDLDAAVEQADSRTTSGVEGRIAQLEGSITNLMATVDTRLTALEKAQRTKKTTKKKKPLWAPALPFSLLSVDYWDNEPYAALGYKGGLRHLSSGETLHKWTLISVTSEQATFRYWNGIKRKLNVEG